ncbi:cryptochrome/photolyase family protein [Wenyingzhuangia sp. chi5]|uniref:Cryptochrome/photolyase family protein n=1 Tax=Wenyingzhuangia gilva TaxID=3057677 RepID=A0ABT8VQD9_9FLAO|nr:cryptochrome/photolyase family protein [Wenyingzhuangia sp. chi5]MDO3694184.1 cryptochrome/photolyase family protein [Wenyingzhuangia sp. chi5]
MKTVNLIFPNQLFKESPFLDTKEIVYLVEEFLFFKQYKFHKQKIAFHRASMKAYETFLISKGLEVKYIEAVNKLSDIRKLMPFLKEKGIEHINYIDPVDDWLFKRIKEGAAEQHISLTCYDTLLFLNTNKDLGSFFKKDKKKYFQTTFYKQERQQRNLLMDVEGNPEGGKWSYDDENRKKYPAKKTPPPIQFPDVDEYYKEAIEYVETYFSENLGRLSSQSLYPTSFKATEQWFTQFLEQRFLEFGTYEDAIVDQSSILHHSVLSPMLNVGLITPDIIIKQSLEFAKNNNIPINSTEGFVRQIIGWREFVRGVYHVSGQKERTTNFWGFNKKIPASFYNGTTGIYPLDETIKKVLNTGYCHHIERLMVLGNFMLLCEFNPDDVYQWFMELFIDAYDWVMVPNVYGMSQFADGGLMCTKPYISGSNYLMKMSNYKKGDWQNVWDGLYWSFIDKHRDFLKQNPRLRMMVSMFDKMDKSKQEAHLKNASLFLESIR